MASFIGSLVPIFGIIFGCCAVIAVARAIAEGKAARGRIPGHSGTHEEYFNRLNSRINLLEERVTAQEREMTALREENRFFHRLMEDDPGENSVTAT